LYCSINNVFLITDVGLSDCEVSQFNVVIRYHWVRIERGTLPYKRQYLAIVGSRSQPQNAAKVLLTT
jgi:hypothetical protein